MQERAAALGDAMAAVGQHPYETDEGERVEARCLADWQHDLARARN